MATWSEYEDTILKKYSQIGLDEVCNLLPSRSREAIKRRIASKKYKLDKDSRVKEVELLFKKAEYLKVKKKDLAKCMNVDVRTISYMKKGTHVSHKKLDLLKKILDEIEKG